MPMPLSSATMSYQNTCHRRDFCMSPGAIGASRTGCIGYSTFISPRIVIERERTMRPRILPSCESSDSTSCKRFHFRPRYAAKSSALAGTTHSFAGNQPYAIALPRRRDQASREAFARATVAIKPGHRGKRVISRGAIAQGMPWCCGVPVVTNSCAFYLRTRGCGCGVHPAFPAPSFPRGTPMTQGSGISCRENADARRNDGCLNSNRNRRVGKARACPPIQDHTVDTRWAWRKRAFAHPSVTGPVTGLDQSIPFCVVRSPGSRFCTGSAQGRHLMGLEEDRSTNLRSRAHEATWWATA